MSVSYRIAFEKSASTISVTSPFFMARSRSSRIPIRTVHVECPLRNSDTACLRVASRSQKFPICTATSFSKTLDIAGRTDMGRKCASVGQFLGWD